MASHRRKEYQPIGKNPAFNIYHDTYDRLRMSSVIFNRNVREHSIDYAMMNMKERGVLETL
jgi:hypothetical protein